MKRVKRTRSYSLTPKTKGLLREMDNTFKLPDGLRLALLGEVHVGLKETKRDKIEEVARWAGILHLYQQGKSTQQISEEKHIDKKEVDRAVYTTKIPRPLKNASKDKIKRLALSMPSDELREVVLTTFGLKKKEKLTPRENDDLDLMKRYVGLMRLRHDENLGARRLLKRCPKQKKDIDAWVVVGGTPHQLKNKGRLNVVLPHLEEDEHKWLTNFLDPKRGPTQYEERQVRQAMRHAIIVMNPDKSDSALAKILEMEPHSIWPMRNAAKKGGGPWIVKNPEKLNNIMRFIKKPKIKKWLKENYLEAKA